MPLLGGFEQSSAQLLDLFAVELPALVCCQIEDVDCALAVSCDMGRVDAVTAVVNRARERREQGRPVAGVDLDHSRSSGRALGDGDGRSDVEGGAFSIGLT